MPRFARVLCWFRRDLRLSDHAALYHALKSADEVIPVFVFDRDILDALPGDDRRLPFILACLHELQQALRAHGGELVTAHASAVEALPALAAQWGAEAVFTNRDYEPAAIARDAAVRQRLAAQGVAWFDYKDQVIFECDEVLTQGGKPFSVFTPYKNAWLKKLTPFYLQSYPVERYLPALARLPEQTLPTLDALGFADAAAQPLKITPGISGAQAALADFQRRLTHYQRLRDFPASKGPSYLSPHLRFGALSIRQLAQLAWAQGDEGAQTWLNELIWREFYQQILWHHPRVAEHAFKPEYDALAFDNDPELFAAWCEGRTGYPIVDAAMRQLAQTGYMHNRLRMIVASFLVKDLLIDWRWGEAHFARLLLDFDLAANNGGWQWAASTGCDAQPYFRIFNPVSQSEKFDAEGKFIRRYVPELAALDNKAIHAPWLAKRLPEDFRLGRDYPKPIVDHATQRQRALALFGRD